jgi:Transposase IS66 family
MASAVHSRSTATPLGPARPADAGRRHRHIGVLLEPSAAQVLRALRRRQPADRDGGGLAHKKLYEIEAEIRGLPPEVWRALRQDNAKLLADALKPWLAESLARVPKGSKLGEALGYGLNKWDGLVRYLGDRTHRYAVYTSSSGRRVRAGRTLAFCWSHLRRKFYELYVGRN